MDMRKATRLWVIPAGLTMASIAWMGPANAAIHELGKEQCQKMAQAGVLTPYNPVKCERLRAVSFTYVDMEGRQKNDGNIVVLDVLAADVQAIMNGLHRQGFPLAKARPMEAYRGDDDASMSDNNTSAFNGRAITTGTRWSLHAYGVAVDLNPLQNPYVDLEDDGTAALKPSVAPHSTLNRLEARPDRPARQGMAEAAVDLFADHGFVHWGGYWNYPIDYQHFEIGPRKFVEWLTALPPTAGAELWKGYVKAYRACRAAHATLPGERARADCASQVMKKFTPA